MSWSNNTRVVIAYSLAAVLAGVLSLLQGVHWPWLLLGGVAVADLVLFKWAAKKFAARDMLWGLERDELGTHELEITEQGLLERQQHFELLVKWSMVKEVAVVERRTMVFYGTLRGLVIPAETVTEGNFDAFVAEVRRRLNG